jgi:uncharacterized protein (TIGR03000 family)
MRTVCGIAVTVLALGTGLVQAEGGLSGALVGWTSGSAFSYRPLVMGRENPALGYVPGNYGSVAPPVFMNTINTPGIYGAYSFGVAPLTLNREALFDPVYDARQFIPAITVTVAPLRDRTTANGAPTFLGSTASTTPGVRGENVALVVVHVPEYARLEFGGVAVAQMGRVRKFTSPPLTPGQKYRYDIRATWTERGQTVVRDRQVFVYAGEKVDVEFLGPGDTAVEQMEWEMPSY